MTDVGSVSSPKTTPTKCDCNLLHVTLLRAESLTEMPNNYCKVLECDEHLEHLPNPKVYSQNFVELFTKSKPSSTWKYVASAILVSHTIPPIPPRRGYFRLKHSRPSYIPTSSPTEKNQWSCIYTPIYLPSKYSHTYDTAIMRLTGRRLKRLRLPAKLHCPPVRSLDLNKSQNYQRLPRTKSSTLDQNGQRNWLFLPFCIDLWKDTKTTGHRCFRLAAPLVGSVDGASKITTKCRLQWQPSPMDRHHVASNCQSARCVH
jgi:hypothetical protein